MNIETVECQEPKIRFIKDFMKIRGGGIIASSLFWINEIHIDAKYKNSPIIEDLIKHEKKHHRLLWERYYSKSVLRRIYLALYNNFWDMLSVDIIFLKIFYLRLFSKHKDQRVSEASWESL